MKSKCIGFSFFSKEFRYAILTGNKDAPSLVNRERFQYPNGATTGELLLAVDAKLTTLLSSEKPELVVLRFTLSAKKTDAVTTCYYSQAMLFAVAQRLAIKAELVNSLSLNAKKLGFPAGADPHEHVDAVIGKYPPHWDEVTKEAVLAAWYGLRSL